MTVFKLQFLLLFQLSMSVNFNVDSQGHGCSIVGVVGSQTPVSLVSSLYRITFYYSTFGRIGFGSQFLLWGFSIMSISLLLLLWDFAEFLVNSMIG
jgi:hypothetical protein